MGVPVGLQRATSRLTADRSTPEGQESAPDPRPHLLSVVMDAHWRMGDQQRRLYLLVERLEASLHCVNRTAPHPR